LCIAQLKQLCHEADVSKQDYSAMRKAMVANQLRTNNVSDPRVIDAMERVARERFVPTDRRALAYVDVPIPLGGGRSLNPPMATARLLTEAVLSPVDRVLLIGAASGYGAALLAELAGFVTAVEEDATLFDAAQQNLDGDARINLVAGPLAQGWSAGSPYDVIMIDGAIERVDDVLLDQLADGGRMVSGVLDNGLTRLAIGRRSGSGCSLIPFADVESVILPGFGRRKHFTF
jgi:protein-L-isoaspartate(D-aspartate) O-methyltransferase